MTKQMVNMHIPTLESLDPQWVKDGIKEPNDLSKTIADNVVDYILINRGLTPFAVRPTIEEGIIIEYRNKKTEQMVEIVTYNTGEVVGTSYNKESITDAHSINDGGDIDRFVRYLI